MPTRPGVEVTTIGDKVAHVKSARQDRQHGCHWPGCTEQVPPAMWGCRRHWYKLPLDLRNRVWACYEPGQETTLTPSAAYIRVAGQVLDWIETYLALGGK